MRKGIEPSFVKGLFSLYSGQVIGTEDLAYYLKVNPSLMDTCILLANLKRSKNLDEKAID